MHIVMDMRTAIFFLAALWLHVAVAATPLLDSGIAGLSSGDSLKDGLAELETRCQDVGKVSVNPPSFPLAGNTEVHLICHDFTVGEESVGALALTYADGKLVMIFAEGNAADVFLGFASGPVQEYLHFSASFGDLLVADRAADRAWVLSAAAAHPNLFMWANPYVHRSDSADYDSSAKTPAILEFGMSLEELQPLYEAQCAFSHLGAYDVWLLSQPELQQQIDCFSFEFAGFPRKIEAVFGDGALEQAWILTGKGEESRVREALISEYGDPVFVNDNWDVFHGKQVMLRKDKPEVLMLSPRLSELYFDAKVNVR
jgi:hypothetical protein